MRNFIEMSARNPWLGTNIWKGKGVDEVGIRSDNGEIVIKIDARYYRPTEVESLLGDSTKAKEKLNWVPETTLEELISEMIENDKEIAQKDAFLIKQGFEVINSYENPPKN